MQHKQPYETGTNPNPYSHGRHVASDAIRGFVVGLRGYYQGKKMKREASSAREQRIADEAYRQRALDLQEREATFNEGLLENKETVQAAEEQRKAAEEQRAADLAEQEKAVRTSISTDQSLLDDIANALGDETDPEIIEDLKASRLHITQRITRNMAFIGKSTPGATAAFREPEKPATAGLDDFKAWLQQSGNYTDAEVAELLDKAAKGTFKIPDTEELTRTTEAQDKLIDDGVTTGIFTAEEAKEIKRQARRKQFGLGDEKQTLAQQYTDRINLISDLPITDDRKGVLSQRAAEELIGVKPTNIDELEDYVDFVENLPDSIMSKEKKDSLIQQATEDYAPGTTKASAKDIPAEKREGYGKLLQEFRQNALQKNVSDIQGAWTRGKAAIELALDGNRSSQITIVNAFMQMTDPGVSVREGEFESVRRNLSDVLAQAGLTIKKFIDGEGGFIMDKDAIFDISKTMQTIQNRTVDVWNVHPAGKPSLVKYAKMWDVEEEATFMDFEKDNTVFGEGDDTPDYHYLRQKGDDGYGEEGKKSINITTTIKKYYQQGVLREELRETLLGLLKNLDENELDAILESVYRETEENAATKD